jgi:hypothetical protein
LCFFQYLQISSDVICSFKFYLVFIFIYHTNIISNCCLVWQFIRNLQINFVDDISNFWPLRQVIHIVSTSL